MKKSIFIIALLAGGFLFDPAKAQVHVSVNIGVQPVWGPVGYDYVDYYYFPDIETYYYVPQHQFIFFDGGVWVTRATLPQRYNNFDLYHGYKVVINDPKPYLHHDSYKTKYISFKGKHDQPIIRESHEPRYFEIKEHPEHDKWKASGHEEQHKEQGHEQHHDEGHHKK